MVEWASWPQACITPLFCEEKGWPLSSSIGRASISARRAKTGPGDLPFSVPITPVVPPTFRSTVKPSASRASASFAAVLSSSNPSSGKECRSLKKDIILSLPASASFKSFSAWLSSSGIFVRSLF